MTEKEIALIIGVGLMLGLLFCAFKIVIIQFEIRANNKRIEELKKQKQRLDQVHNLRIAILSTKPLLYNSLPSFDNMVNDLDAELSIEYWEKRATVNN